MTSMVTTSAFLSSTSPAVSPTKDIDQLVATLRNDPSLHVFLSDDFSPQAHVGTAVVAQRVEPALQDAQRASTVLSASVRQHVIRRKEALLAEVEAVDALEREVTSVSIGVSNLVVATTQLSDALDDPYTPMRAALNRATNIAKAISLVSALQRFRVCTDRLKIAGLLASPSSNQSQREATTMSVRNLPAAAEAAKELEQLLDGHQDNSPPQDEEVYDQQRQTSLSIEKVDLISKDTVAVRKAIVEVRKRAAALLKSALAERSQTDVEAAVMSFHALGMLQERIASEINRLSRETQAIVHRGLEGLSTSSKLNPSATASFEKDVWAVIDMLMNTVADACFKALLLQHVLSRKYCPTMHASLLYDTTASSFIVSAARIISEEVSKVARLRNQRPVAAHVFTTLAEGYPKLRSLLKDISSRIHVVTRALPYPITEIGKNFKLPIIPDHDFIERSLLGSVGEVETQYLTASLGRLTKTVRLLFENGRQPGETEALNFTKMLAAELDAARSDHQLKRTAINNVATAIRLYSSHAEDYAAANAPDIDSKGMKTIKNESSNSNVLSEWYLTTVYNGMIALATSGSRILCSNDDGSGEPPAAIKKELDSLSKLSELLLDGLFSTCRDSIGDSITRMHTEDLEAGTTGDDGCSVYVLDIATQLSMFAECIIASLARSRSLGTFTLQLAQWTLQRFVSHATLVFPQARPGTRARLATDMARMELAVDALCPARLLGQSYKQLRALRACILTATDNFCNPDQELRRHIDTLPLYMIAQSLLARSNDPLLLQPHRRLDRTPAQYFDWLEKHSEEEAWSGVEDSLNLYAMRKDQGQPNSVEHEAIASLYKALKVGGKQADAHQYQNDCGNDNAPR